MRLSRDQLRNLARELKAVADSYLIVANEANDDELPFADDSVTAMLYESFCGTLQTNGES